MAIDVTTFVIDVPSGTSLTAGEEIQMKVKDGPAVVRSGYGAALLKRVISFKMGAGGVGFRTKLQNSDWVDPVINDAPALGATVLDRRTSAYQSGNSCPLTPNSSWYAAIVPQESKTTTADMSIFMTVEIDYPSISNIVDPDALVGTPCTLIQDFSLTTNAIGAAETAGWVTINADIFKAGYQYALQKVNIDCPGNTNVCGLLSLSNAAGMRGISRTVPVMGNNEAICMIIEYASKLVKGPMDIKLMLFESAATARTVDVIMDYVKHTM